MNSPDTLIPVLKIAAACLGQSVDRARIDSVAEAIAQQEARKAADCIAFAWAGLGLAGTTRPLDKPEATDVPFLARHAVHGWLVVLGPTGRGAWAAKDANGIDRVLDSLEGAECVGLPSSVSTGAEKNTVAAHIWGSLRKRSNVLVDAAVATLMVNLLALAASFYAMQVYDRVIPNNGYATLIVLTVGVILAILFELGLKYVRSIVADRNAKAIDAELSDWFFHRVMGIRMNQRPRSVGTLAAQVKSWEYVRNLMTSVSLFTMADLPFVLLFIGVIALIGGWLVLVPLIFLPLTILTGLFFQRWVRQYTQENVAKSDQKIGQLVEAIEGAEYIKATGAEWKFRSRWQRLVDEVGESDIEVRHLTNLSQQLTQAMQQIGYVSLIGVGAWLVTQNSLSMGGLIACSILLGRVNSPIAQIPALMVQWAHARVAMTALEQVVALPNDADDAEHKLAPQAIAPDLTLNRVVFEYAGAQVKTLDIPNLKIKPGEKVGLIGAIGSGKSTLLKLASGLYQPKEGRVLLGGIDMAQLASGVRAETVGYLPQDVRLFSGTLRENLLMGLTDPGDDVLLDAARQTGLIALISSNPKGLALPLSEGGAGVSGGQRQLIGLTRMLLAQPKLWLLDEPTSAMDALTEGRVIQALREATKEATVVIATHRSALFTLVDRLIVIGNGQILADGPRDKVLAMAPKGPAQAQAEAAHA